MSARGQHDTHAFPRPEVPDVVGHEERSAGTDGSSQDRNFLRVRQDASPFSVLCRGPIDSYGHRAEEFLEERQGFRELRTRVRRPISPRTRIAWLAPVRERRPAMRTSASRQTETGSVFPVRAIFHT